ncbi:hypothetical protein L6452_19538 [Arctium lappa]|uniref:Uncharacterized protein n=1 Tax=Arctium lappa TaxID=4217 RepID=A0ACB9B9S0_ARCLA|nr:hypothetical protein L6452_19538 [Arctium lappa]
MVEDLESKVSKSGTTMFASLLLENEHLQAHARSQRSCGWPWVEKELVHVWPWYWNESACGKTHNKRDRRLCMYMIAYEAHDGQKRRSGEPFIIHLVEVTRILGELILSKLHVMALFGIACILPIEPENPTTENFHSLPIAYRATRSPNEEQLDEFMKLELLVYNQLIS